MSCQARPELPAQPSCKKAFNREIARGYPEIIKKTLISLPVSLRSGGNLASLLGRAFDAELADSGSLLSGWRHLGLHLFASHEA